MHAASVEYRDIIVKVPNGSTILDGITLSIERGERVAFVGRSGAGKTTALKVVNGLVNPFSGQILVEGESLESHRLVAVRRRIGYVMQRAALFPHRTVYENVAVVPRLLGWPDERVAAEAEALLGKLELPATEFGDRYPRMLSGGQQQRVAIARALIASPPLLLCDEPFSALDPLIRADLQALLRTVAEERPETTILFVTHDVREAIRVAERVVLFEGGRIVSDTTADAFLSLDHPLAKRFVAATWGDQAR